MSTALLLENIHHNAHAALKSSGFTLDQRVGAMDEDELIEALKDDVEVLGIRSKTYITKKVIENAPNLVAIGAFCIGTNQIDLAAAAKAGIAVFNAPYSNTRSVVELAIGEIITLTRHIPDLDRDLQAGLWNKTSKGSHEVRGRTLGIVGYGNIGSQLSVLAESMGMHVIYFDIAERLALGNAVAMHSLDELLKQADVVSLHIDERPSNRDLFGRHEFETMKDGALFINLGRGITVDLGALHDALEEGHLGGAAIDVYQKEPKKIGDPFDSNLRGLKNTILTPHIGGSTMEAQESIGTFVAGKLRDYVDYGSTAMSKNLPNLPELGGPGEGNHRICHIHANEPGVLAKVNQALAERGVNIVGQALATGGEIGYVVSDIASPFDPEGLDMLRDMPQTIRVRIVS